jgi:cytochrome c553
MFRILQNAPMQSAHCHFSKNRNTCRMNFPWFTYLFLVGVFFNLAHNAGAVPVVRWDFGAEETSQLEPHGGVHRDVPGPRPPEFPDQEPNNTAVQFDGSGAYFSFQDFGPNSYLDFTNGDSISLESWVNLTELKGGDAVSIVGKGRTGSPHFSADNQNWALRLRESGGEAHVNFLFATPRVTGQGGKDSHWHRWTATEGFAPGSGWHHIAVAYRFGAPDSIRGWLDGRPVKGKWDMGGETLEAPVVDDDAVWIGSTKGGAAANSFRGMLDAVAIHRELLGDAVVKQRFRRNGEAVVVKAAKEMMPELGGLPEGRVQVTFHEGVAAHNRWLNEGENWPEQTMQWSTERFLMPRLPARFDAWGIREVWKGPMLVRFAADVVLPSGRQRFLMRTHALGRLWLNGEQIVKCKELVKTPPDGEEPVAPVPAPPLAGVRAPAYGQLESFGEGNVPENGKCRLVLETLVGGPKLRAELGEVCVAVQTADGLSFDVISAQTKGESLALTNAAVEPELKRLSSQLEEFDATNRRLASASQDGFWKARHEAGKAWAAEHMPPPVPAGAAHPIDAFLNLKVQRAVAASAQTSLEEARRFHSQVLGVLRDECFRCHGDKEKGGLRLNSRESALQAGESGKAAVVPGSIQASELISRIRSKDDDERMPPKGQGLKQEQIAVLEDWVKAGAIWPAPPVTREEVSPSPMLGDAAYLRRLFLDLTGVPPSEKETREFIADQHPNKREREIDRLLSDRRWADSWMPYWMDVLAENPALINPTLNTTGPFRWFLLDAFQDNKPMDRFVSELLLLRGSPHTGGSAGFGVAGENDSPFATKGQIVASAFLGIELQCARCHDSPYHSTKQADLYALAAMFEKKPVKVPKKSTVPAAFFEKKARESLIKVTLKPDEAVPPVWPFAAATGSSDDPALDRLVQTPSDARERFAALVTAPQNIRFAQVLVNRVWRRFIGAGFVEPVQDWEGHLPSHPELLEWLAQDFVAHGYDLKQLTRRILTSELYQREATGSNLAASPELRFFAAPERRRLTAEQVVDSLHAASGRQIDAEEITFDPSGRRAEGARINLGKPTRAWMFANLTNERDRPSLSLPYAQCVVDVLEAFGWSGARQSARTDREVAPNVLQPGVLANGALAMSLIRAADGSEVAKLAIEASSPESLVESVFLRFLSRLPSAMEAKKFTEALREGFGERLSSTSEIVAPVYPAALPRVTWFNHLNAEANTIALENDKRARKGPPADPRLRAEWRERYEDFVWSLVNSREFVWMP